MTINDESVMATSVSLLDRLRDWGQQTAWREFAHEYGPLIRNVARKAGLSDLEAGEVVQEVMIAVAKNIGEFKHGGNRGSFRSWLYQQARWRVTDQFRARGRGSMRNRESDKDPALREVASLGSDRSSEDGNSDALTESGPVSRLGIDPGFQELWDSEWAVHLYRSALARVKGLVSARQFQLFELHVGQGLPVSEAARAAGASIASVYMAKSRVGRLLKQEMKAVSSIELKAGFTGRVAGLR